MGFYVVICRSKNNNCLVGKQKLFRSEKTAKQYIDSNNQSKSSEGLEFELISNLSIMNKA